MIYKRLYIVILGICFIPLFTFCGGENKNITANRPNVIFILSDDLGFGDLGCHGNPVVRTPHIDNLSATSLNFTNYHASPYCTPTRASIMTGKYSHRTGARITTTMKDAVYSDILTLGDYFRANGYSTSLFGKWHIGCGSRYKPADRGFEETLTVEGGGPGTTRSPWKGTKWDDWMEHNGVLKQYEGYTTDNLFTEAMSYMKNRGKSKPFFLYLPTFAPHRPWNVPEEWAAQYKNNEGVSIELAYFFAAITRLDYNVGRLIIFLKENNLYDNTVLVFTSDNGSAGGSEFYNAGHRGKKGSSEEHGHRLPCFVHWPAKGIDKKIDNNALTAAIDWLPTFIDLCDLEHPEPGNNLDGRSMANLILNKENPEVWQSRIHIMETPANGQEIFEKNRSVIMKGPWRLINKTNLTNLEMDPYQKNNIIDQEPELVHEMLDAYKKYWDDVSKSDSKEQPIYLGDENSCLSITNVKVRNGIWQQQHILTGHKSIGTWGVEFTKSGNYEFDFRRWPKEINAGLTDSITVEADPVVRLYDLPVYVNSFGNDRNQTSESTQLPIEGVIFKINDEEHYIKRGEDDLASIKLPVKKGKADLQAVFVNDQKEPITSVYYLYVSEALNTSGR